MSHLGARIMAILREDRPYELRDSQGKLLTKKEAMELIRSAYRVPEETRQARRRRKPNEERLSGRTTREAAKAPQPGLLIPPPKTVYGADLGCDWLVLKEPLAQGAEHNLAFCYIEMWATRKRSVGVLNLPVLLNHTDGN